MKGSSPGDAPAEPAKPAAAPDGAGAGAGAAAGAGAGADSDAAKEVQRVAQELVLAMSRNPRAVADAVLDQMDRLNRAHLVLALQKHAAQDVALRRDTRWADDFVRGIEAAPAPHRLSRSEVLAALEYQRVLSKLSTSAMDAKPTNRQLMAVALASGVPFVAFGFIDNGVMLASSEQIDSLLGARFGLTTLASAALGNIVADVFGVGVTQQIQNYAKRIPGAAPPRLSTLQQGMTSVKTCKLLGACIGVTVGCIFGMVPLFFNKDKPPTPEDTKKAEA